MRHEMTKADHLTQVSAVEAAGIQWTGSESVRLQNRMWDRQTQVAERSHREREHPQRIILMLDSRLAYALGGFGLCSARIARLMHIRWTKLVVGHPFDTVKVSILTLNPVQGNSLIEQTRRKYILMKRQS